MAVDGIAGDQVAPHVGEFKLNSFSAGTENTIAIGSATNGAGAVKAAFPAVKVSMRFNAVSSPSFYRAVAAGTRLPSIEVRFYNSRMFYKTVFENVFLTNVSTQASDEASQELEFVYSRVRWFAPTDPAGVNAPVQVACWDVALATKC
jgi:type VI protein secretion system component Hcp